ncbi:hypothetical protein BD769DRAFT_1680709 [Suillus cothurnatus]|nr:hypothetical protein BD769DRAFT_1680709 [Suillus cothurnatus]
MAARWFGTVIDPDASLDLDLAQDFAWPKLGSIDDLTDNIQGRLEVSLQSKLGAATVTSFNESSPLETASDVTVELTTTSVPSFLMSQAMALSLTKNASPKPLQSKSFATRTPASILRELHDSPEGFYAASPRLIRHVEYFIGGRDGNILVSKGGLQAKEFIIRGVFEISRNDFNFTPDANFNPSNVFHGRFSDVKLSCQLIAGRNDRFRFSSEDFPDVLDNIAHFEGLIPRERDYEKLSAVSVSLGQRSIRLIHGLFEAKNEDQYDTASDEGDDCSTNSLSSDFDISTWPVANRCRGRLEDLTSTHNVCPLPAYDTDHGLIPPLEYESKLKGALVEVHMAFCHHRIKNAKRDVFNAILRQLTVLSPPAAMPINPFKRHRLDTGPLNLNTRNKKAKYSSS